MGMDAAEGGQEDPLTLNKYVAFNDNGVDNSDPSGNGSGDIWSQKWFHLNETIAFHYALGKTIIKWAFGDDEIREGHIAARDHNPGDVTAPSKVATKNLALGIDEIEDGRKFAIFATDEEGNTAMDDLLHTSQYYNATVQAALLSWNRRFSTICLG